MSSVEDEWEYEYDQDATETFLLDLDLTSLNGGLRADIPGKRPLDRPQQTSKANASNTVIRQQSPPIEDDLAATPDSAVELQCPFGPAPNSVQVLDFPSYNPIISYQNEVYSCTWSDMVGTNMFFTPAPSQWSDPDEPVELLGTSRIRLIGHRAKIEVKQDANVEGTTRKGRPDQGGDPTSRAVINNPAFKRQADFLERLKGVKKAKGETDVVRMVVPELGDRSKSSPGVSSAVVEGIDADGGEENDALIL